MVRPPDDRTQPALQHNPECRNRQKPLHVPCRGGLKNQTSLLPLCEAGLQDVTMLENFDPIDVNPGVQVLCDSGQREVQRQASLVLKEVPSPLEIGE